jgi:hypothetical protein
MPTGGSATPQWTGDLATYRQMLINHEFGHLLGQRHPPAPQCPVAGEPALVMSQQSTELDGCLPQPWPLPAELARGQLGTTSRWRRRREQGRLADEHEHRCGREGRPPHQMGKKQFARDVRVVGGPVTGVQWDCRTSPERWRLQRPAQEEERS